MGNMLSKSQNTTEQKTLSKNWEKYRGNIVMVVGDEIFATKRAKKVHNIVKEIEEKFHRRPLITYIPKEGTLVLFT
ncbi:hypothetical protein HYT32_01900 [Candidatus Roizmanbacteria bacterium]|nr:hypothetical protein [Candidatus Roizmanbacteria bacterium]